MLFTGLGRSVLGETVPLVLGPWSLVLVKKRHFYVKKLVFFFTNFTVVKKLLFYVKILLFYKLFGCKNPAFLHI